MSRKGSPGIRSVLPDPKHGSEMVARFINMVMKSGKKSVAEKIVYGAMDVISVKNPATLELVEKALGNVAPSVEVKSRRVGGATYQVPVEVRSSRRTALAMRWLIDSARKRGENTMPRKLAAELLDASENRGGAVKKREETHRMAEANKAFSHFPLVIIAASRTHHPNKERLLVATYNSNRSLSQLRHHGSHRCWQDDDDRTHPFLYRRQSQDWRGA